jgi:D-alanyl-D-alanine carboxypeptidase (penicillin-binding protein 5/6)
MTKIKSLILTIFIAVFALPMAAMAQPDDKLDSASSFDMKKLMSRAISGNLNDQTTAKQAIIIDFDTGMVLMEKDADTQMPTASMSKTMTLHMVFKALKEGKIALDTMLPVSEKAWQIQGSKMWVELGKAVSVEDLIRGVAIQSGNDATIVLAEGLAGTEEAFATMMNEEAKRIGMMNSNFTNASGWPDPNHYSTARDLAILAVDTIRNYPEYYPYYAELEYTYHNIRQANRNPILTQNLGADGIKTGHTEEAGYGLMASAVRDGRRIVLVINGLDSMAARAQESARLVAWAQSTFENVSLFKAGDTVEEAEVVMGQSPTVPLVIEEGIKVTLKKAMRNDLKVSVLYKGPLQAPVKKGDVVGSLKVEAPGLHPFEVPLVAGADVAPLGLFAKTIEKAKVLVGQKRSSAPAQPDPIVKSAAEPVAQ